MRKTLLGSVCDTELDAGVGMELSNEEGEFRLRRTAIGQYYLEHWKTQFETPEGWRDASDFEEYVGTDIERRTIRPMTRQEAREWYFTQFVPEELRVETADGITQAGLRS